jgi:hypothetical protein
MIDDHSHPFAVQEGPIDISIIKLDILSDPDAANRVQIDSRWRTSIQLVAV